MKKIIALLVVLMSLNFSLAQDKTQKKKKKRNKTEKNQKVEKITSPLPISDYFKIDNFSNNNEEVVSYALAIQLAEQYTVKKPYDNIVKKNYFVHGITDYVLNEENIKFDTETAKRIAAAM